MTPQALPLLAALALGGVLLFERLGLPVAWLLGSMVASIGFAGITGKSLRLPEHVPVGGQLCIAVTVGLGFSPDALTILADQVLPMLGIIVITAGLSMANGHLLARFAGVDQATAFLGSVPGGAAAMVAMAGGLNADTRVVAILQYLRILLIIILAPLLVQHLIPLLPTAEISVIPPTNAGDAGTAAASTALPWPALLVLGIMGQGIARRLRIPAANFLGPFLIVAGATLAFGLSGAIPVWLFQIALGAIGMWIGLQFDLQVVLNLRRAAAIEAVLIVFLMVICALLGYGFSRITGIDPVTALLGSVPGGWEVMVASSLELGADTPVVVAMQMTRFLGMVMVGPLLAHRLASIGRKSVPQQPDSSA